jgi:exonuclease 3'-5' domain-containing protein 2
MPTQPVQNEIYSNWKMLSPEGEFMCHLAEKRARWYLDRDLAEEIEPRIIQLKFTPKGDGHDEDGYYGEKLKNICVVCGTSKNLTKHHVVPAQFRKHFSDEFKNKSHFDVLTVCVKHHMEYELRADILCNQLARELGFRHMHELPEDVYLWNEANRLRHGLVSHADKIPVVKVIKWLDKLKFYTGNPSLSLSDLEDLHFKKPKYVTVAHLVVQSQDDIFDFILMWRQHFLDMADPQHLSEKWLEEYKTRRR